MYLFCDSLQLLILLAFCALDLVNSQQLISQRMRQAHDRTPSGTAMGAKLRSDTNGGAVKVDGTDLVNLHDKLIQRITSTGSNYYLIDNGNGKPLYRRHEIDANRDFIVFPDPNHQTGDGHYVVLRRLYVHNIFTPYREPIYQGFYLIFSDSVHAYMRKWEPPTTTENPKMQKMHELERRRKAQPSYTIENTDAVDFGDFVRREKRQLS